MPLPTTKIITKEERDRIVAFAATFIDEDISTLRSLAGVIEEAIVRHDYYKTRKLEASSRDHGFSNRYGTEE